MIPPFSWLNRLFQHATTQRDAPPDPPVVPFSDFVLGVIKSLTEQHNEWTNLGRPAGQSHTVYHHSGSGLYLRCNIAARPACVQIPFGGTSIFTWALSFPEQAAIRDALQRWEEISGANGFRSKKDHFVALVRPAPSASPSAADTPVA